MASSDEDTVRGWLDALPKADFQGRGRIIQELLKVGGDTVRDQPGSVASLLSLLHDRDAFLRIAAARAMGRLDIEAEHALAVVTKLIDDDEHSVHLAAVHALVDFSAPPEFLARRMIAGLGADIDTSEIFVSKMALIAIGGPAVSGLCHALEHGSSAVRRRSAAVLGGIRERYAGTVEGHRTWRRPWAHALPIYATRTREHLAPAIRALLVALRDADPSVQKRAAEALEYRAIDRIPIDVLGEYLDTLIATRHPSAPCAMADALASKEPAVVAIAALRAALAEV